jgi:SprA-related family
MSLVAISPVTASTAYANPYGTAGARVSAGTGAASGGANGGGVPGAGNTRLTPEQQRQVEHLKQVDKQVRAHEAAHQAAGAGLTGAANFTYVRGPDGKQYAVAGDVSIDVSPAATPQATIAKAQQIQRAALAPRDPSPQDMQVAATAAQLEAQARAEERRLQDKQQQGGGAIAAYGSVQAGGASSSPGNLVNAYA